MYGYRITPKNKNKNELTVFSLSTKDILVIFAETVFSFLAFSGERVDIIVTLKIKALGKTEIRLS